MLSMNTLRVLGRRKSRVIWMLPTHQRNQAAAARGAGMKAKAELPSKIALQDNSAANKAQAASTQLGYAYDPKADQTVAVTADEAKAQGLTTFRKVNQTQIAGDTHNASVLNDVSSK